MIETGQRYRIDGIHCRESPCRKCSPNRRLSIWKNQSLWLFRMTMYEGE